MNDASEVIERLKARFRVDSDSDLAARLLISRSTVANWRNRNSIPPRYQKIADGEIHWSGHSGPYGDLTDIERESLRLAMMRIVRDFGSIATDYRAFLEKSGEAAASWQIYCARATKDLYNEMAARGSDNANETVSIMAYNEVFAKK